VGMPLLRLEVLNQNSGVSFAICYEKRIEEIVDGLNVNFIDRDSLLVNEPAAGRAKDLADIDELGGAE